MELLWSEYTAPSSAKVDLAAAWWKNGRFSDHYRGFVTSSIGSLSSVIKCKTFHNLPSRVIKACSK